MRSVSGPETVMAPMSDGVTLATDIYRPTGPGRHPALLMRQPYGRRIASTVVLAHPAWYAAQGYVVMVQDVRGRGDSGGRFAVLANEATDGAQALDFAAHHPACNGQVAMYGFSYQAMTQLLALAGADRAGTKRPDAIIPAMGAWSVRDDWAYEGGAFRLAGGLNWACQIAAEQARLADDRDAFHALASAAAGAPWTGPRPGRPAVLAAHAAYAPHFDAWLRDDPDAFAGISPDIALSGAALDVPALFVGGWFDIMLTGTLAMHRAFHEAGRAPQRLVVGPWAHIPWSTRQGAVDHGEAAASDIDRASIAFLDAVLKRREPPGPAARLFDLGASAWRDLPALPRTTALPLFLASDGLACASIASGRLLLQPGGDGEDRLVHDPWRPAPAIGGHLGQPSGMVDRSAADQRADVAVFTSAPLTDDLWICGDLAAELHVDCDMRSHDLHCTLSMLPPGRPEALTLSSGCLRVPDAAAAGARHVPMRATAATLKAGARLRLSVQAAAYPAFAVNPGTGARAEDAHVADAQVTTLTIRHGVSQPSRLILPVAS